MYLSIRRTIKRTVVIIEVYHFSCQLHKNIIKHNAFKANSIYRKIIGDHQCGLRRNKSATDRIILHSSNT